MDTNERESELQIITPFQMRYRLRECLEYVNDEPLASFAFIRIHSRPLTSCFVFSVSSVTLGDSNRISILCRFCFKHFGQATGRQHAAVVIVGCHVTDVGRVIG